MKKSLIFLLTNLFMVLSCAKDVNYQQVDAPNHNKYVVGYLFANDSLLSSAQKVNFSQITHLNVAFINPEASGVFSEVSGLRETVALAHAKGVKVFASFAGGNPPAHIKQLLTPSNQAALITSFATLIDDYDLDGIDVDLEGDFIDANYESFVLGLDAMLTSKDKLMTAAVATWTSNRISDTALHAFDLIHIMSYDHTGPWDKTRIGQHSSFEDMVIDFEHWRDVRQVAASKLTIGLPFYGYGFGPAIADDITFGKLVEEYPLSFDKDEIVIPNQGTFYYNGTATIKRKSEYTVTQGAGGVMIWHLLADTEGQHSLLKVIETTFQASN